MPCGWEGNRRSGVALAMRQTSVVYPPTGSRPRQADEHPAYALLCIDVKNVQIKIKKVTNVEKREKK